MKVGRGKNGARSRRENKNTVEVSSGDQRSLGLDGDGRNQAWNVKRVAMGTNQCGNALEHLHEVDV